jgi:hypothetical protein
MPLSADITGSVPVLSSLTQLRQLDLEFNFFSGQLSGRQLCPPGNRLHALMLRANNFTGPLDLRTCWNLTVLDVQVGRAELWVLGAWGAPPAPAPAAPPPPPPPAGCSHSTAGCMH